MHMTRLTKSNMGMAWLGIIALALICEAMRAQESVPLDLKPPPKKPIEFRWHVDQRLVQSLGQNTQAGGKVGVGGAGGITDGSIAAIIAVCRKQSAAASSLLASAASQPQRFKQGGRAKSAASAA
jgi:hypothetical protein